MAAPDATGGQVGEAAGLYDELYRPQYHFTPAINWMNDPNGLVFFQGEYHLFYQHNPFGIDWGHMSWGHATSPDLVHWKHLPVALKEDEAGMIFSGSVVVDSHSSSSLCKDGEQCLVAAYTIHNTGHQTQGIAASGDRGRTWTKYEKNPVIDIGYADFRDPKVFWHEPTHKWVMATVLPTERKVRLFGSQDLKTWTPLSDFGPAGATAGVWECPDLFPLAVEGDKGAVKWVFLVSVGGGAAAGGSGIQYFVGDFDGTRFHSDETMQPALWCDYGRDYYAAQTYSNIPDADGRTIAMGWVTNLEYAGALPTKPWRGVQSAPRSLTLMKTPAGPRLRQKPVREMEALREKHFQIHDDETTGINSALAKAAVAGDVVEIAVEFEARGASEFGIKVRKGEAEETSIGYDTGSGQMFVDRTRSGDASFHKNFAGRQEGPLELENGRIRLHILVDRSMVEVFGNGGRTVITDLIFPKAASKGLEVFSHGGDARVVCLDVWQIKSTWK